MWVEAPLSIYETPTNVEIDKHTNSSSNLEDNTSLLSMLFYAILLLLTFFPNNYYRKLHPTWRLLCTGSVAALLPLPLINHELQNLTSLSTHLERDFPRESCPRSLGYVIPLGIQSTAYAALWSPSSSSILGSSSLLSCLTFALIPCENMEISNPTIEIDSISFIC